jgi:hypothetical protein
VTSTAPTVAELLPDTGAACSVALRLRGGGRGRFAGCPKADANHEMPETSENWASAPRLNPFPPLDHRLTCSAAVPAAGSRTVPVRGDRLLTKAPDPGTGTVLELAGEDARATWERGLPSPPVGRWRRPDPAARTPLELAGQDARATQGGILR